MLWSLLKIVFFVALVAALTLGAGYLMETGPGVRVAIGSLEFNLGPLQAVLVALVLFVAVWLVLKAAGLLVALVRFLNGDETAISRYFDRNRERKGYQALSDSLMALASGEGKTAMAKAARAERLLQKPELTNLVTAQACEMIGDRRKAEETYKRLLTNENTRFVGIRGIMKQKLEDGDTATALKLAEKAFALKPRHEEVQTTLLRLQAESGDFSGARKTLGAALKAGNLPRDVHRRRDAVLALSEARDVLEEGKTIEARMEAIEANRLSPDLVPAAVMAARAYIADGKQKNAARVLKKTWESQPHPDLATAFAEIEPKESARDRVKRFEALTKVSPDNPETKMLLAELLIAAEDFPGARRAMGDLAETAPTARALSIMAAIERGVGADDAVVRGWLARAVTAPRGPQWVCDNCQSIASEWGPVCTNCHAFDTLSWRDAPTNAEPTIPSGAAMLPLIVGSPAAAGGNADAAEKPDVEREQDATILEGTAEPSLETMDVRK